MPQTLDDLTTLDMILALQSRGFVTHHKMDFNAATGSEMLRYAPGLVDVYGGDEGVLLTVRRAPGDVFHTRSVELTAEQAREIAFALSDAANAVLDKPQPNDDRGTLARNAGSPA